MSESQFGAAFHFWKICPHLQNAPGSIWDGGRGGEDGQNTSRAKHASLLIKITRHSEPNQHTHVEKAILLLVFYGHLKTHIMSGCGNDYERRMKNHSSFLCAGCGEIKYYYERPARDTPAHHHPLTTIAPLGIIPATDPKQPTLPAYPPIPPIPNKITATFC